MSNITIQSVELINFMCHSNLKVNFEKMITCIGGRNGSGKSAVMAALGIVFGQRARELDRGNSYKNLIKTGTSCATIRVRVNNYKNYKIEKYGQCILIEKKLKENSANFSISNHLGKIFNLRRNELEMIIETYNLRFDNPLNFLTQEGSKKFLNISSPKSLYDFYYVGTEFKNIDEDLENSKKILDELGENIEVAKNQLNAIEIELGGHYSELKFLEYDPEATLKKLKNEEHWLNIVEDQKKIQLSSDEIETLESQVKEIEAQRAIHRTVLEKVFQEQSYKDQEEEKSGLLVQEHGLTKEIEDYQRDKESIDRNIHQIKSKSNTEELISQINQIEENLKAKKDLLVQLESTKDEAFQKMQSEREENQIKSEKRSNYKKQIEYLKKNAFDPNKSKELENVKKLKQELSKHQFKDLVIGPLHEYVSLKNPKWFKVVSIILRKSLNNFIVFNSEDKVKLYNIFNQLHLDHTVSQMKSKRAYNGLKANPEFLKLMDVIDIRNDIISNQLVTMNSIEQLILIEDRSSAHNIIMKNPRNVDSAYTPSGDRIKLVNGSLTDFRQRDDGYYWFEDKSSKIRKYEMEMNAIEISEVCKSEYSKIIHQIGFLSSEIDSLEKRLSKLTFELETYSNLKENDTGSLEKQSRRIYSNIESLMNKRENIRNRIGELNSIINQIITSNQQEKNKLLKAQDTAKIETIKLDHNVMVLNNKIVIRKNELKSLMSQVENKIKNSEEKPEVVRELTEIVKERSIALEYRQRIRNMCSRETLEDKISKLERKRDGIQALKNKFEASVKETNEIYNKRMSKKEEIKVKNTQEAIESFKEYTARSGYEGIMTINHEYKSLDLKMKVHNSTIAGSKSTLSGGERSFAGVCFLLSMWKCFRCPVKVLDEFDVFMDTLNRRNTIISLLEFFKENEIQVILITPLDTSDLEDPDVDIKVLKKQTAE